MSPVVNLIVAEQNRACDIVVRLKSLFDIPSTFYAFVKKPRRSTTG